MKEHGALRGLMAGLFEIQIGYVRKPIKRTMTAMGNKLIKE